MPIRALLLPGLALSSAAFASTGPVYANDLEQLVVQIDCTLEDGGVSEGSGVLVSDTGHVLTARHVAPEGADCIGRIGNRTIPGRALLMSFESHSLPQQIDGRLLKFAPSASEVFPFAKFCRVATRKVLDPLVSMGFHSHTVARPSVTAGVLSSTEPKSNGLVETDAEAAAGKSGGPVFLGDTPRIVGIVAGAQFDHLGTVTNYALLAVDALLANFPVLTEAPDCVEAEPAVQTSFAPLQAYFASVLLAQKRRPENNPDLIRESTLGHRALYQDLSDLTVDDPAVQSHITATLEALRTPEPDPSQIRDALSAAAFAQANVDLGAPSLRFATLTSLRGDFEAALLARKDAAELYSLASASFPPDRPDLVWDSLFSAGTQLARSARDTTDKDALTQAITLLKQADAQAKRANLDMQAVRTQLALGSTYVELGERTCGVENYQRAEEIFDGAVSRIDPDKELLLWADLMSNRGLAMYHRARRTLSENLLDEAIALLREIIPNLEFDPSADAKALLADTKVNLGRALQMRSLRETDTEDLELALDVFEDARTIRNRQLFPYEWSIITNRIGLIYGELGRRTADDAMLEKALATFDAALSVRTRTELPVRWAETQQQRARTILHIGRKDRNALKIKEAIGMLEDVLLVRKRELMPIEWAQTHASLGVAHFALGDVSSDPEHLQDAIDGFEKALTSRLNDGQSLRDCHPLMWASSANNLGNVYVRRAEFEQEPRYHGQAIAEFERAGEVWRSDTDPLAWARLQHNIGTSKLKLGQAERSLPVVEEAIQALELALGKRKDNTAEWSETAINLGWAMFQRGAMAEDQSGWIKSAELLTEGAELSGDQKNLWGLGNYLGGYVHGEIYKVNNDILFRDKALRQLSDAEQHFLEVGDRESAKNVRSIMQQLQ